MNGTANFAGPTAAVPEPATITLLATGLLLTWTTAQGIVSRVLDRMGAWRLLLDLRGPLA